MKSLLILLLLLATGCGRQQKMPEISLQLPDSSLYFNTASLQSGKATVLVYYQPYCPACRAEWQDISSNTAKLNDLQICLITDHSYTEMMAFYKQYNLKQYSNVVAEWDTGYVFSRVYKPSATPYHAFFDKDKRYRGGGVMMLNFKQLDSLLHTLRNTVISKVKLPIY